MKIEYFPETDTMYIDLSDKSSKDSIEVSDGITIDYDEDGNITGIDIDQAQKRLNLKELSLTHVPFDVEKIAA